MIRNEAFQVRPGNVVDIFTSANWLFFCRFWNGFPAWPSIPRWNVTCITPTRGSMALLPPPDPRKMRSLPVFCRATSRRCFRMVQYVTRHRFVIIQESHPRGLKGVEGCWIFTENSRNVTVKYLDIVYACIKNYIDVSFKWNTTGFCKLFR